jgi:hypothetical protein
MGADEKVAHSEPASFPLHLDTPEEELTLEERIVIPTEKYFFGV